MDCTLGYSGRANRRRDPADKQSKKRRRDSANKVSYAKVLLPEPLGPTKAINLPEGSTKSMLRSVFCEAPFISISMAQKIGKRVAVDGALSLICRG